MENNTIGKINSILPILTVFVILYGVLKSTVFYAFFRINILSYLDFTELVPSIIRDLIFSIIAISILMVTAKISGGKKITYDRDKLKGKSFFLKIKSYLASYGYLSYIIYFTIVSLIIGVIFFRMPIEDWYYNYSYWIVLCVIIVVNKELAALIDQNNSELARDKVFQFVLLCSLSSTLLGINRGLDNYHNLIKGIKYNTSYIEIGERVVKSSKEYYYIGKTKSSIFFMM